MPDLISFMAFCVNDSSSSPSSPCRWWINLSVVDQPVELLIEGFEDPFWILRYGVVDVNIAGLADPIDAVRRLLFPGRIPPASIMNDVVCLHQGEPNAGHIRRQHEQIETGAFAEAADNVLSGPAPTLRVSTPAGCAVDDIHVEPKLVFSLLKRKALGRPKRSRSLS